MPGRFANIGFPAGDPGLGELAAVRGVSVPARGGSYRRWAPGAGAEVWARLDSEGNSVGLAPHFDGGARMRVGLTATVQRPQGTSLDGALHGWGEPSDDGSEGLFPLVFDQPDHSSLEHVLPRVSLVQLAAFAEESLQLFENEAAYLAPGPGLKMAVESFIPTGLFVQPGSTAAPRAIASFTGTILDAELRRNPVTEAPFHWLRVRTLGGEVDVVAAPPLVPSTPVRGGVLQGSFWLSGRIVE